MAESPFQWTNILPLTALLSSAIVLAQVVSSYTAAYQAAPHEIATFVDTADFSVQENESYDRDVAKVQRLEDKIRLTQLLREIQKTGDDLREDLNGMVFEDDTSKLRTTARLLWASKRSRLEDRVRRLDMLRMRFLVVYMGTVASGTAIPEKLPLPPPPPPPPLKESPDFRSPSPVLPKGLMEGIISRPPLRSFTPAPVGHQEQISKSEPMSKPERVSNKPDHTPKPKTRTGWAGVVEELQTSPRMQERHASIERAMSRAYTTM
ncbi:hypothetical protein F66182_1715 [Fusarium sp. NRRL 66182]|nr:hypothetical protein F66182_1715 [Fusarium sp. NRRL 66182]